LVVLQVGTHTPQVGFSLVPTILTPGFRFTALALVFCPCLLGVGLVVWSFKTPIFRESGENARTGEMEPGRPRPGSRPEVGPAPKLAKDSGSSRNDLPNSDQSCSHGRLDGSWGRFRRRRTGRPPISIPYQDPPYSTVFRRPAPCRTTPAGRFIYINRRSSHPTPVPNQMPDLHNRSRRSGRSTPYILSLMPACAGMPVRVRTQTGTHADRRPDNRLFPHAGCVYSPHVKHYS